MDEEFVLERRVGETFVLGTATWRIEAIEPLRVIVGRAAGQSAMAPFWRGEEAGRSAELGEAVGRLCREVVGGLDDPTLTERLSREYHLDPDAAEALRGHLARQLRAAGAVPDDRTVLVESFIDQAGETGLAVLTPFGGKLHQGLKLVLQARLKQRFGIDAACLHADTGLLFRLPQTDEPPVDLLSGLSADLAESFIRAELGESALFGLRFRQNAARALLMPRPDPTKRTPLWLQRLRAKDLLQVVRGFPDFPVVIETYRECLNEDLDLARLRSFFDRIASGTIRVVTRRGETPSPFVSDLIFRFELHFMYQWDEPKRPDRSALPSPVDNDLLDPLLTSSLWLDPAAIGRVESRLRQVGQPPRTVEEMAEMLRRLGDLAPEDLTGPMLGFLETLLKDHRACRIVFPAQISPDRWISVEEKELYENAFSDGGRHRCDAPSDAIETIVRRHLQTHALVGLDDLTARYPIGPGLATEMLERWADDGTVVRLEPVEFENEARWAVGQNLNEVRRLSIALKRRESVAVLPEVFADFLVRRQGVHPEARREGSEGLAVVIEQLQGFAAPAALWESELFPARLRNYRPSWLDELLASGDWLWRAEAEGTGEPRVAFMPRTLSVERPVDGPAVPLSEPAERILSLLTQRGASFTVDLVRGSELEPSRVRAALDELARRGQVTNDRFGPALNGAKREKSTPASAPHGPFA